VLVGVLCGQNGVIAAEVDGQLAELEDELLNELYLDAADGMWFPQNVLRPLAQQLAGDKLSRLMPEALRVVISNWCGGTAWAVRIVCDGYRFQNLGTPVAREHDPSEWHVVAGSIDSRGVTCLYE
jgi:hypothetical protein